MWSVESKIKVSVVSHPLSLFSPQASIVSLNPSMATTQNSSLSASALNDPNYFGHDANSYYGTRNSTTLGQFYCAAVIRWGLCIGEIMMTREAVAQSRGSIVLHNFSVCCQVEDIRQILPSIYSLEPCLISRQPPSNREVCHFNDPFTYIPQVNSIIY